MKYYVHCEREPCSTSAVVDPIAMHDIVRPDGWWELRSNTGIRLVCSKTCAILWLDQNVSSEQITMLVDPFREDERRGDATFEQQAVIDDAQEASGR